MILKFKNKYMLALDKLIDDGIALGGILKNIDLSPDEARGLLLELIDLGKEYISNVQMLNSHGDDVVVEKLVWAGLRTDKEERVEDIISGWCDQEYWIKYKNIPVRVVLKKPDVPPAPPTPPPSRFICDDGSVKQCTMCGSPLKTKWFFFKSRGCIQPTCDNYWRNLRENKELW